MSQQQNIKSLLKYLNRIDSDLKFSPETPLTAIWEQCCDFLQSRKQEGKFYPELEEFIDRVTPLFISDEIKLLTDAIADLTIPSQSRLYNNVNSSVLIQPSILQIIVNLANENRRTPTLNIHLRYSRDFNILLIDTNSKGVGFSEKGKFVGHPVLAFLEDFVEYSANFNRGETYQIVVESNSP